MQPTSDNRTPQQKLKAKARFFEAQWLDVVRAQGNDAALMSAAKQVADSFVVSNYYQAAASDLLQVIAAHQLQPQSLAEVGPSLGRACYELVKGLPTLKQVELTEPSALFFDDLVDILSHGKGLDLLYVKGKHDVGRLAFDTRPTAASCQHLQMVFNNHSLEANQHHSRHDLVMCLNVIDQCQQPGQVVQLLQQRVKPGGLLYLSCTYQWQKKLIAVEQEAIDDIKTCFAASKWQLLHENELEYKLRYHERFAHAFLSHGVIYQKL